MDDIEDIEDSNSTSQSNEKVSVTLRVILNKVNLDVSKPVELVIKYDYNMFSSKTFTTGQPSKVSPKEAQNYNIRRGYEEYTTIIDQSALKMAFDSNPLEIRVYDNRKQFGNATVTLSKLLSSDAEDMPYGQRYRHDFPICGLNEDIIGTINCTFVLEREQCILCKVCDTHFKPAVILKHIKRNKKCRPSYTEEDIECLEKQAAERKKEKRNIRNWLRYKPEKRAKLHTKYYNPVKRAAKHRRALKKENKQHLRELRESNRRILNSTKKNMEKEAIQKNFQDFEKKKTYFEKAKEILCWEQHSIPENIKDKIETFEHQILELHSKLDGKIEKTSTFIDDLKYLTLTAKSSKEMKEIWGKMKEKVCRDWKKLGTAMDQEFKDVAKQLGAPKETINWKFRSVRSYI